MSETEGDEVQADDATAPEDAEEYVDDAPDAPPKPDEEQAEAETPKDASVPVEEEEVP